MANILSEIEKILDSAVTHALLEEADELQLQLKTSKSIKSDKRSLAAADGDKKVEEAEDEVEEVEEETETKTSKGGGDMSRRKVRIPSELPAAITPDMIITGIDSLRSARSLKDPAVREDFEEYFDGLTPSEKVALLAFINGLAETLIGGAGVSSQDPSEEPYNVEMAAQPDQGTRLSKANEPLETKKSPEEREDTPIVVGG